MRCLLVRALLCCILSAAWLGGFAPRARASMYQVGPSRAYHSTAALPALQPGDQVEIDPGTYHEVMRWTNPGTADKPILIRGTGASRPVFDGDAMNVSGALPHPRAVFQVEADYIVIENLEFRNARNGDNGAGIRVTSADHVTVRKCRITQCDMGVMCDNNRDLLIESSEIASNGTSLYNGYSHNLYLGGDSVTLRFCYIHDALYGQNVKSRAHYTELLYNYIADSQDGEVGLVDASETAGPNSHAVMIGNIVISKPRQSGYNSGRFIQFGQDLGGQHNGILFAFNNTFVAGDGRIQFLSANTSGASIIANNNIFYGRDKLVGTLGGGIGGSNNWAQTGASVPAAFVATVRGSEPGFINRNERNLHLTATSDCRNKGAGALRFQDGAGASHSGAPGFENLNGVDHRSRPVDGQLDIGAYEYRPPSFSSIRLDGRNCIIGFSAVFGDRYNIEHAANLSDGDWSPLITNIPGIDGEIELIDTNGADHFQRFYRLKAAL